MSNYGHDSHGHSINGHCNMCGGTNGHHYNSESNGGSGYGGSGIGQIVFGLFVILGIVVGVVCPPVGALVIALGAKVTGV